VTPNPRMPIPLFLSGDVTTAQKVKSITENRDAEGAMIGRAAIGNPWFFNQVKHYLKTGEHLSEPTIEERLLVSRTHLHKSIDWKEGKLGVYEMRKHYSNYFRGLHNVKAFRDSLVRLETVEEIEQVFSEMEEFYQLNEAVA